MPSPHDYDQFIELARAVVAAHFHGRQLLCVTLEIEGVPRKVCLPVDHAPIQASGPSPQPPITAEPAETDATADEPDRRHSQCVDDILAVLEAARKPLTTSRLMSALARAGKEWSQRHVERTLARMVEDGTLENPPEARPRGYRLLEWDSDIGRH